MKNKKLSNIAIIISLLIFTGLGIVMVVRNIPYGLIAVLWMGVINVLAVILLIAAVYIKKKLWAVICRIVFIGWLIYVFFGASVSANDDAILYAVAYAIAGILTIVFGIFRHKAHE